MMRKSKRLKKAERTAQQAILDRGVVAQAWDSTQYRIGDHALVSDAKKEGMLKRFTLHGGLKLGFLVLAATALTTNRYVDCRAMVAHAHLALVVAIPMLSLGRRGWV